jgi:hypothetical protein
MSSPSDGRGAREDTETGSRLHVVIPDITREHWNVNKTSSSSWSTQTISMISSREREVTCEEVFEAPKPS